MSASHIPRSIADLRTRSASHLDSGTLPDARLSANVPRLNQANVFTGAVSTPQITGTGAFINMAAGNVIYFSANGNQIRWDSAALFAANDNVRDLGYSSLRWRDLLLGRNAYIGGKVGVGLTPTANMLGISVEAGLLTLKETTTPTADPDYGKLYFKSDNKLYAQTGDGVEHAVAFV